MTYRNFVFTLNNPKADIYVDLSHAKEVKYFIYSEELGEEGTNHLQGTVVLHEKKSLTAFTVWINELVNFLDTGYVRTDVCRDLDKSIAYCSKIDETHISGPYVFGTVPHKGTRVDIHDFADAVVEGKTNAQLFQEGHGSMLLKYGHHMQILRNLQLEERFLHRSVTDFDPNEVPELDLRKACLLYGPTNTGKTSFALAQFKNPLLVSHTDDLKELTKAHDGIVFDDMDFRHQPSNSVIHMLDIETTRPLHARFHNVILPRGLRRIFTFNDCLLFYSEKISQVQEEAVDRRVNKYFIANKLYI